MYDQAPDTLDAYLYSPAFAQVIWPLTQLPWPVFFTLWTALACAAFVHLLRPLGWGWTLPLLLCCTPEILAGNVFWLLALVAAHGLRHPWLWAVPALTKVAPAVGPLWFLARGEWRRLAISVLATGLVVTVSLLTVPELWRDWMQLLRESLAGTGSEERGIIPPFVLRAPAAALLVVWCARTDRRWGIPVGMVLISPVTGIAIMTMLTALPRLLRPSRDDARA